MSRFVKFQIHCYYDCIEPAAGIHICSFHSQYMCAKSNLTVFLKIDLRIRDELYAGVITSKAPSPQLQESIKKTLGKGSHNFL